MLDSFQFEYHDQTFENIDLAEKNLEKKQFESCSFKKCNFSNTLFKYCCFTDCEFIACNLSLTKFTSTSLMNVIFESCKLIGVDWTKIKWPLIKLTSPIKFYQCDLSLGNFFEVNLIDTVFEQCKAHELDLRGADLLGASLCYTDFYKTLFQHCNLSKANFTGAINYLINPLENKIAKAKFSFPDVIGLLKSFDIEIKGLDDN